MATRNGADILGLGVKKTVPAEQAENIRFALELPRKFRVGAPATLYQAAPQLRSMNCGWRLRVLPGHVHDASARRGDWIVS
jgi:hypothetical protein